MAKKRMPKYDHELHFLAITWSNMNILNETNTSLFVPLYYMFSAIPQVNSESGGQILFEIFSNIPIASYICAKFSSTLIVKISWKMFKCRSFSVLSDGVLRKNANRDISIGDF